MANATRAGNNRFFQWIKSTRVYYWGACSCSWVKRWAPVVFQWTKSVVFTLIFGAYLLFLFSAAIGTGLALRARLKNAEEFVLKGDTAKWSPTFFDDFYAVVSGIHFSDLKVTEKMHHAQIASEYGMAVLGICVSLYAARDLLIHYASHRGSRLMDTELSGDGTRDAEIMAKAMSNAKRVTIIAGTMDFIVHKSELDKVLKKLRNSKSLRLISTKSAAEIRARANGGAFLDAYAQCISYNPDLEPVRCSFVETEKGCKFLYRELHGWGGGKAEFYLHSIKEGVDSRVLLNVFRLLTMHEHWFKSERNRQSPDQPSAPK